ncbi:hypothetical protein [Gemmatimonas phototrophica]|uniref:Uncharacterized protein n=1 Tax=Gemmatimonas phototrophica TaxID=1379270 RepID=A0A143BFZ5_9BACT|nr:hypothetical protein [Gemmatimonas phototrophica]AMW03947.1 hypothetical protein GEMMAAP_02030 [Gemmatimonas phototrophica]
MLSSKIRVPGARAAVTLAVGLAVSSPLWAQGGTGRVSPTTAAKSPAAAVRWRIVSSEAAQAWFALLADLRLAGVGAFAFTSGGAAPGAAERELSRALAGSREWEILHFLPLYYPSADRLALGDALRVAASDEAPVPRATLLVGALRQVLSPTSRRAYLPTLADALGAVRPTPPGAARTAAWQAMLDSSYLPALAPWLVAERLDEGRLIVAPALGAEGRLFAGTADRKDNLAAVGSFASDSVTDAPLLAFTRESCFPAVSRAAREAGLRVGDPTAARRASLAAVRCGAALLDRRLPERAGAYRRFWLARLAEADNAVSIPAESDSGALRDAFARAFPPDPALSGALERAIGRLPPTP